MYIKYLGNGREYIRGVPRQDLTRDQWEKLSDDTQKLCIGSGLYKVNKPTTTKERKEVNNDE